MCADWTDAQRATVEGISTGIHWNTGDPCECGPDPISTRTERAYSDSLIFHHRCTDCGATFSTWIEG